jgi:ribosomal protein L11 methyltransferase
MYLWQKMAKPLWLSRHEVILQARADDRLAIISSPGRKRLQIEITCPSRNAARQLLDEFGGRVENLPRDWLKRFTREESTEPLRIGNRLIVSRTGNLAIASTVGKPALLVIPAGAAFGTGDHPTTAMSLRFLEEITRNAQPKSVVDLGTGSGILALAAKRFGAQNVWAIDSDPIAISTAKENARINKIGNVKFRVADLRCWKFPDRIDVISANLFSELLIELLPKLSRSRWLVLSGILRAQERQFRRALRDHKIDIVTRRRRGKWIAMLAQSLRRS